MPPRPEGVDFTDRELAWIEAMLDCGGQVKKSAEMAGISKCYANELNVRGHRARVEYERRAELMSEEAAERRAKEAATSRAHIIEQTMAFLEMAKGDYNVTGGMKCVEMLAKLGGHLVQKTEVKVEEVESFEIDPDTLTAEEFEKWAAYEELREAKKASGS